jgi:hypothetical protein
MTARYDKTSQFWQGTIDLPAAWCRHSQNRESHAENIGRTEVRPTAHPPITV